MTAMRNLLNDLPLTLLDPGRVGLVGKCAQGDIR